MLLTLLRDDGDTKRYYAYANAMLGRPYDQFFVRPGEDGSGGGAHSLITPGHALIPWRDFPVEYPPGVLIAALPPALFAPDFASFHFLFSLEMELMLTAAAWLGVRSAERLRPGAGRPTLILSIVYLVALGVIGARRYDGLVALAIAAAVYGLAARKPALAGFALAASVLAKGAPALIAPIGAWHLWLINRRGAFTRKRGGRGDVTFRLGRLCRARGRPCLRRAPLSRRPFGADRKPLRRPADDRASL